MEKFAKSGRASAYFSLDYAVAYDKMAHEIDGTTSTAVENYMKINFPFLCSDTTSSIFGSVFLDVICLKSRFSWKWNTSVMTRRQQEDEKMLRTACTHRS